MTTNDLGAQQRAAKLTWLLLKGGEYTTKEVASMLGVSYAGAHKLLQDMQKIPDTIKIERYEGRWRVKQ